VRAAFEFARAEGRGRVTLVDKANAMPAAGGLWRRAFADVAADFGEVAADAMYVDAMAMDLVRRPATYQVLVTSNLFGDILSDLAAVVTGGIGLAPSANLHPGRHALFEPVQGESSRGDRMRGPPAPPPRRPRSGGRGGVDLPRSPPGGSADAGSGWREHDRGGGHVGGGASGGLR
jgi:hypothetical protein